MSGLNDLPIFFLASNSAKGYISYFKDSYCPETGWDAYVLRGSCGFGKSLLLKRLAGDFTRKGCHVTLIPSVNDPKSLDGLILEDKGIVIFDGDLQNALADRYPAVCEKTVDMGGIVDEKGLVAFRPDIIDGFKTARGLRLRASNYIAAASSLFQDNTTLAAECSDAEKTRKYAAGIAEKEFPKPRQEGKEILRFLSGITPTGLVYYRSTVPKLCKRIITLSDEFGASSGIILQQLRAEALERGLTIITCCCPISAQGKIEHLLIPALDLAFVTANRFLGDVESEKTVHARRFSEASLLRKHRQRMNFNRKAGAELLDSAVALLSTASAEFELIDGYYNAAMNYDGLEELRLKLYQAVCMKQ